MSTGSSTPSGLAANTISGATSAFRRVSTIRCRTTFCRQAPYALATAPASAATNVPAASPPFPPSSPTVRLDASTSMPGSCSRTCTAASPSATSSRRTSTPAPAFASGSERRIADPLAALLLSVVEAAHVAVFWVAAQPVTVVLNGRRFLRSRDDRRGHGLGGRPCGAGAARRREAMMDAVMAMDLRRRFLSRDGCGQASRPNRESERERSRSLHRSLRSGGHAFSGQSMPTITSVALMTA